jgi:hypothetical protein
MTEKTKKNHSLPQEVFDAFDSIVQEPQEVRDAYMRLLRDKGWTYQSISSAVGLTRERVRQCVEEMSSADAERTLGKYSEELLPFPEPPNKPEKIKKEIVMPSPETLRRLKELQPKAAQVRYNHMQFREEGEEYASLLWHAHTNEGVSVYRLGKLLDVLPCGIESRFVRYGYKESNGSSSAFNPIKYRKTKSR